MKKGLTIGTLVALGACALMLILSVFGISFFEGVKGSILATTATLTAAGYFGLRSNTMLSKNKILGYISFGLIGLSLIFMILFIWSIVENGIFNLAVLTVSLLSVLFIFLVSNNLKLGKQFLPVQIICEAILSLLIVLILISSYGWIELEDILTLFWITIILSVVSIITISILANKVQGDTIVESKDGYVKIAKKEYEELLAKAKELKELKNK